MENVFLSLVAIPIVCLGIYVFFRPCFVSEQIRKFYSNYPVVRCAGDKQLTSRIGLIRVMGVVLAVVGIICLAAGF